MLHQPVIPKHFSRFVPNKRLILQILPIILLTGCTGNYLPRLLSASETTNAKPQITEFLDRNAQPLTEDVQATAPIRVNILRQTNEILPFECWELSVATSKGFSKRILWKLYNTVDDAVAEQNNLLKKLSKTEIPLAIPIVWDNAKPYASASSALFVCPRGMTIGAAIAWKANKKIVVDGKEYTDLVKLLSDVHNIPVTDSTDNFPVREWLPQMAEVGVSRGEWDSSVRDELVEYAKGWKPQLLTTIHGDMTGQNVWVDSTFSVSAIVNWERMGTSDPAIDWGYLLADATVIQPFEMRERYGTGLPDNFAATEIGKAIVHTFRKDTGELMDPQFVKNLRAAFALRVIQTYLYQHQDPLLQLGMKRIHSYITAMPNFDPISEMIK